MARGTARGVSCAALCGASSLALAAALAPLAVQPHHADCSCSSAVCKCGGGPRRESGRVQPAAAGGRRGGRRGRRRPAAGRRRAAERASAVHGVPLRACTALRRAGGQLQGFQGVFRTGIRVLRCSGGPPAAAQRSRAGGATEGAATRCPGAAAEARPRPPAQVVGQGGLPGVDLRAAPLDARTKLALQAAVALMAAGGGVFGAPRARAPPRACPSYGGAPA